MAKTDPFVSKQAKLDEMKHVDETATPDITRIHHHPQGWEPGIEWDGLKGRITTYLPDDREMHDGVWDEVIADWGLDSQFVAFQPGSVQIRGWDANVSEGKGKDKVTRVQRMKYYRATLIAREDQMIRADVNDLITEIKKRKPLKAVTTKQEDIYDLIVNLSDWQMGKGEGDGSAGTVARILDSLDNLVAHVKDLKKVGRAPRHIYLVGMGDLVEQCSGHYPMQAFQVDLDRREQMKVVRRLLLKHVDALHTLCERLILTAVPGNHGENRQEGKAYTTFTDNDDLAVFDGISEIVGANPDRYHNVRVMLSPKLSTSFHVAATDDFDGIVVGITHMHAGRSGKDPRTKVMNWWRGHTLGRGAVHDADILITAHYHHFMCDESTGRTWFQTPAMDPGSAWYEEATGVHSNSGLLVFSVSPLFGDRKWGDLRIL